MQHEPTDETRPAQSRLSPLIAAVAVVVIFFGAQIVGVNLAALLGMLGGRDESQLLDWLSNDTLGRSITLTLVAATGVAAVSWLLRWTRTAPQAIGLKKPQLLDVGRALIGYGWYFLIFLVTMTIVGELITQVDLNQQQQLGFDRTATDGLTLLLTGASLVLLPAFYEELLVRGVLFSGLRKKLSFVATALVVSLTFAAAHLEWGSGMALNWAAAIDTFVLSMVLVYLREKTDSLWPAIFLHGIKNLVAFTLVFVLKVG